MHTIARVIAVPIAAWCFTAGMVGGYRFVHDGWIEPALPAVVFFILAGYLARYAVKGQAR